MAATIALWTDSARFLRWLSRREWRFGGIPTVAIGVAPPVPLAFGRVCMWGAVQRRHMLYTEHAALIEGVRLILLRAC